MKHVPAAQSRGGATFNPALPNVGGGAYLLTLMGQQRSPKDKDDEWTRRRKAADVTVVFGRLIRRKFAFRTRTRAPVTNRPRLDTHHHPQSQANKWFLMVLLPSHGYANRGCRAAWRPDCRIIHPIEFLTLRREFINEMHTRCTSSALPRQQSARCDAT